MRPSGWRLPCLLGALLESAALPAQSAGEQAASDEHEGHHHAAGGQHDPADTPPLPEGMTLEEVLDYSAKPPPEHFPDPVPDDHAYTFTFVEQLEYRLADSDAADHLGWEAQGWTGGDVHRFWWKSEGEARFEGGDTGESETDFLYARLVSPFWNLQAGLQYANEWRASEYEDRWSAVVALQGLAPYRFEVDGSLYVSEDGDVTLVAEGEYDLRITQRLVLQPRAAIGLSAGDAPERRLGSGLTDVNLDLRLRYEIRRELAPYVLLRYESRLGETADIAEAAGEESGHWFYGAGIRFAF